ncbi:MAG: hypothetical protein ACPGTQ_04605 [Colwellia sp.]
MQLDTAYQTLGLAQDASQEAITQAYQAKLSDVTAKKEKAPTPALEAKFEKMLEKLARKKGGCSQRMVKKRSKK